MPETAKADLDIKVDVLDLPRRSANVLKDLRIRSIRQLLSVPKARLLQAPRFGSQSMAEVEQKVSQYLAGKWPPQLACQDGEKEALAASARGAKALVDHRLSILPERERDILRARYGLWDGKAQTLTSIANRLNVSRERVRQIEARELCRLGRVFGSYGEKALFRNRRKAFGGQQPRKGRALAKNNRSSGATANDCTPQELALAGQFLQKVWKAGKQDQHWRSG